MKAIVCEMCGSNDLIKIDGQYQCQHCKTKYTVDEARKLLVEGKINVTGTVQIDNSNNTETFEKLAFRAYENQQYDQAYEYYSKLLEIDADNWLYVFRKGECSSRISSVADFKVDNIVIACKEALKLIDENTLEEDIKEVHYKMATEINDVAVYFRKMAGSNYSKNWELQSAAPEYWERVKKCVACEEYALTLLKEYIQTEKREFELYKTILKNSIYWYVEICKIRRYKSGVNQYGPVYANISYRDSLRPPILAKYDQYVLFLRQYDPTYVAPQIVRKGEACYVATCVYGSYDCPEVWVLRRYRDYELYKTWYGKAFVKLYYATSPTIVKLFGKTKWFNKVFKKKLDKKVMKLKAKGYTDIRY